MKNIISYKLGTSFTGREIKEWLQYHLTHETSKTKYAKQMARFLSVKDEEWYILMKDGYTSSETYGEYYFARDKRLEKTS